MANAAYVRVSTIEQNESRQVEALQKYDIDQNGWFKEKVSGKDSNRPQLQELLKWVRKGDCVYILDFSRLARNTKDLLDIVDTLNEKQVKLISLKENFDTSTNSGQLMLTMLSAIYEFERKNILERQREGIAIAKRKGNVYKGRKKISIPNFDKYYDQYMQRKTTKYAIAKELGVSRTVVDRLIKEKTANDS